MASLRGRLLIATPDLLDPNFRRTVLLVTEHSDEGAMGLVLNRPLDATVDQASSDLAALVDDDDRIYSGGPVQPNAVVVLAEWDDPEEAAVLVDGDLGFVPAGADLALVAGSVRRARVYAGYAGWGPGQLDAEVEDEGWILERPEPGELFAPDPEELWSGVLRRKGGRYALVARMPPDPSMN